MRRRRVLLVLACGLAGLTGAVLGSPPSRADEPAHKFVRLGYVSPDSPSAAARNATAFWERLRELGWIEGQNIVVERRWADTHEDRLPALMNDVLARGVTVIVTVGTPAALAATRATSTIPIVRSSQVALRVGRTDSLVEGSPALTKSLNS